MEQSWKEFKREYKDKEYIVLSEFGPIDFSKDGMKDVVGGKKLTFDQYLNAQRNTNWTKTGLQSAYYQSGECDFMGIITKKNKRKIMFERLYISGYGIEMEIFSETENNVWMDVNGFEEFKVGDAVSFVAVIYRYLFTKYGQQINYGVKNRQPTRQLNCRA